MAAAGATFTTLVDQANVLSDLYGFKAVPNGFLIDEAGIVNYSRLGGFDIGRQDTVEILHAWLSDQIKPADGTSPESVLGGEHAEANALFREGQALYRAGKIQDALALWRRGMQLNPENYLIRKQIWAVEHPERFYDSDVDYAWQREQMAQGR